MNVVGPAGNIIQPNSDPTQESEIEIYNRLEADIAANLLTSGESSSTDLSLENSPESPSSGLNIRPSSRLSISGKQQFEIAPDINDLKKSQDLHNRLQTTSEGLAAIEQHLSQLATSLNSISFDKNKATTPQDIISQINETINGTKYNETPVFNNENSSEYSIANPRTIQEAILINKESLNQDANGKYLTKGNEAFILSSANKHTLYSFAPQTPLEEINQKISQHSEDISIHPLFYVENQPDGQPEVINHNASGTAGEKNNLTLTPIDGKLFSQPLTEQAPVNRQISNNTISIKIVDNDDNISLSKNISQNHISGTINLAEDTVQNQFDIEKMRDSNHALTRADKFNERINENKRQGDGFALTPEKEEQPISRHIRNENYREELTAIENNKENPGSNTTNRNDILLMPEKILTPPPEPASYVTLQERELGITGEETKYQTDKIFLAAVENKNTDLKNVQSETNSILFTSDLSAKNSMVTPTESSQPSFTDNGNNNTRQNDTLARQQNNQLQNPGKKPWKNSEMSQNSISETLVNTAAQTYSETKINETNTRNNPQPDLPDNQHQQIIEEELNEESNDPLLNTDQGITELELTDEEAAAQLSSDREIKTTDKNNDNSNTPAVSRFASSPASSATRIIQSINGIVQNTLNFTLSGKKGSVDFVISAGNTNETVAQAINSTQNITGVTASTTQNSVTIQGEQNRQLTPAPAEDLLTQEAARLQDNMQTENNLSFSSQTQLMVNNTTDLQVKEENQNELTVNLTDLGHTERNGNTYTLQSLPAILNQNSQTDSNKNERPLELEVINNALNEISALQNNLRSLSSLNERNVNFVSQQINAKLLPESAAPLTDESQSADIEQALNLIAVGINNSTSADGGLGVGTDPLASLNLLTSSPTLTNNRTEPSLQQNLSNIEHNQTAYDLANMQAVSSYNLNSAQKQFNEKEENQEFSTDNALIYSQLTTDLSASRMALEEINKLITENNSNFANHIAQIEQASENFFTRIENSRLTIRELGREFEASQTINTLQKERYAEKAYEIKSYNQQQINKTAEKNIQENTVEQLRIDNQEFNRKDFHEILENIGHALGNRLRGYTTEEIISELQTAAEKNKAPASTAFSGTSDSNPVVTTSATQGSPLTTSNQDTNYKSLNKIINGKLGTIMVHGQDYTLTDLYNDNWQIPDNNTDSTITPSSILEKAIQEIAIAENINNKLAASELSDKGDDINNAINSYGSDLSATTPAIANHAAQIQSMSKL